MGTPLRVIADVGQQPASWLLAYRLNRPAEHTDWFEARPGLVTTHAADALEITAALTVLASA